MPPGTRPAVGRYRAVMTQHATGPRPVDLATADGLDPAALRARGSLKWTALDSEVAAWVAESDLGTAPTVRQALHDAVDGDLLGYLPPAVRRDMAQACADWYQERYGWTVPPSRIHPVADVLEALHLTVEHFSRPGSALVLPTPAYMPFLTAPGAWGRDVVEVPMAADDSGRPVLDLAAIDAALAAGGHLVVLTNPHNPTGRVFERAELVALSEVVQARGGRVFSDEIHAPLVMPGARHVPYASVSAEAARHTVTATSASKSWNIPGLKCAQVLLSNDDDAATWEPHDVLATHGASTLGAVANAAAYRTGGPWLDALLVHLDGNRRAFAAVLAEDAPQVRFRLPEGTYLAWLDLRDALPGGAAGPGDDEIAAWVLERFGVAVVDGTACGEAGRGFVRVNLALPRPLVIEAGRRIAACLAGDLTDGRSRPEVGPTG